MEESLELSPAAGAMLCIGKGSICGLVQSGQWGCSVAASLVPYDILMRPPADCATILALQTLLQLEKLEIMFT